MKAIKLIACLATLCLLLSSCSLQSRRINDLTVVQALAIDGRKGQTEVSLQYLNLFANGGSTEQLQGNITEVCAGRGKNISCAIANASKSVSNSVFQGQNKIVIFGFDYAKSSIDEGLEYLLESSSSRPDVLCAMSKGTAGEIIKSKEKGAKIPAENLYKLLKLGEENAQAAAVTACDLLNLYNDETSDIFLPVLSANENKAECCGVAVFSNEKYAKTLSGEGITGFLLAKNRVKRGVVSLNSKAAGITSLNILSSAAKHSVEIKNNKIVFCIKLKVRAEINETEKSIKAPLGEKEYILLKKEAKARLESICKSAVLECFSQQSDPFMCARYLYLADMSLYHSLKNNWRASLPSVEVEVNCDLSLIR